MINQRILSTKQENGQFYTSNAEYILDSLTLPIKNHTDCIIEPFAGKGDLVKWVRDKEHTNPIRIFDIDPQYPTTIHQDTLMTPPDYTNSWIITNPPYLARNKSPDKTMYNLYKTNDLYKCFIHSISGKNKCLGGIIIIPAGFFFSPRKIDVECRNVFMQTYSITKVRYFEESVFDDTTTTVVAISFIKHPNALINNIKEQDILWERLPSKETRTFRIDEKHQWIIGGELYHLSKSPHIHIRRHVSNVPLAEGEQQTFMTLNALDSGKQDGRISLTFREGYVYPAKEHSRTYATLRVKGIILTDENQKELCTRFNDMIESYRKKYWSLFLPQFRESKEYARKRIPFTLAYLFVAHIIQNIHE
jgi:hypothetical protein